MGHDNKGLGAAWHLEKVEIDLAQRGEHYTFPCGRWLAKGEDDGEIERTLYASKDMIKSYSSKVGAVPLRWRSSTSRAHTSLF